jgi:hypothetical protein
MTNSGCPAMVQTNGRLDFFLYEFAQINRRPMFIPFAEQDIIAGCSGAFGALWCYMYCWMNGTLFCQAKFVRTQ